MKIVIIGNSGSGKTWLATRLAALASVSVVHLDELFWLPGGFDKKRPDEEAASLIAQSRNTPGWVVEGVFGELAAPFLEDAQALVWLNPDWAVCRQRLLARGSESKAHMERAQSDTGLARLLEWASAYPSRGDSRSYAGHLSLFQHFQGHKLCLQREEDAAGLVNFALQAGVLEALQRFAKHA
ncbi:AAA family ATPase [Polaromonas sp. YR568]|uniref:AAA family ATPase n=1 Tax=Polaromonas sp. YR568 TaxID=1855301 RepID=UPI00398BD98B